MHKKVIEERGKVSEKEKRTRYADPSYQYKNKKKKKKKKKFNKKLKFIESCGKASHLAIRNLSNPSI